MRKYLLGLAVLLMGTAVMTSCSSDDDDAPKTQTVTYSTGAYIVNSGNMYSNIESSLTAIDFNSNTATQNVFKTANGRSLGNTANDGLIYGSKMYIVVDKSNTIEVLDKKTLKSVKQISTTELMGDAEGKEPRHIIASDGNIYFTTYGGYVAKVDTVNFNLGAKYQVGSYPEGLALLNGKIYVANSNYAHGGGNISRIDLTTGKVDTKTIEGINNPTSVYAAYGEIYVIENQTYGPGPDYTPAGENALMLLDDFAGGKCTKVTEGNYVGFAVANSPSRTDVKALVYYVLNAPYGGTPSVTRVISSGSHYQEASFALSEMPYSPCGIFVDPVTEHIFVLSYNQGDYGADLNANGYVVEYDAQGNKLRQYNTGVGQVTMFFDNAQKEEPIQ